MNTIDYIYRFDPNNPSAKPLPNDADVARRILEDGNRMFSRWMESCRTGVSQRGRAALRRALQRAGGGHAAQRAARCPSRSPFAVVVGCSDARVPTEMLFGQGFNDLFVIRVAGNVLGDVCMGSVDFALNALSDSVRVVVVLGHSGCGAVTGAVDAYLQPQKFWSKSLSPMLRGDHAADLRGRARSGQRLERRVGTDARDMPGYREALIESAVSINAAQAAFDLRQEVERNGKWEIEVLYGVHNIRNHQVCMPVDPYAPRNDENVRIARAPTNPARVFRSGQAHGGDSASGQDSKAPRSSPASRCRWSLESRCRFSHNQGSRRSTTAVAGLPPAGPVDAGPIPSLRPISFTPRKPSP